MARIFFNRSPIVAAKLLLQVSCGAPFFLLVFTHAARNFLGYVSLLDLDTFPMYAAVLLLINASMLGMLKIFFSDLFIFYMVFFHLVPLYVKYPSYCSMMEAF
jgi:hypothetical protein